VIVDVSHCTLNGRFPYTSAINQGCQCGVRALELGALEPVGVQRTVVDGVDQAA